MPVVGEGPLSERTIHNSECSWGACEDCRHNRGQSCTLHAQRQQRRLWQLQRRAAAAGGSGGRKRRAAAAGGRQDDELAPRRNLLRTAGIGRRTAYSIHRTRFRSRKAKGHPSSMPDTKSPSLVQTNRAESSGARILRGYRADRDKQPRRRWRRRNRAESKRPGNKGKAGGGGQKNGAERTTHSSVLPSGSRKKMAGRPDLLAVTATPAARSAASSGATEATPAQQMWGGANGGEEQVQRSSVGVLASKQLCQPVVHAATVFPVGLTVQKRALRGSGRVWCHHA